MSKFTAAKSSSVVKLYQVWLLYLTNVNFLRQKKIKHQEEKIGTDMDLWSNINSWEFWGLFSKEPIAFLWYPYWSHAEKNLQSPFSYPPFVAAKFPPHQAHTKSFLCFLRDVSSMLKESSEIVVEVSFSAQLKGVETIECIGEGFLPACD